MKKGTLHTKKYRLLSLLIVLTMLSSHMAPIYCATDGSAEQGLLVATDSQQLPESLSDDVDALQTGLLTEQPSEEPTEPQPVLQSLTEEIPPAESQRTLICQITEHTHEDGQCWQYLPVCGMEEGELHVHEDACLEPRLVCKLPVQEAHAHVDVCYGISETVNCGKTETEAHQHSAENGCYTARQVLDCSEQLEAHAHSETCTVIDKNLTCQLSTEPHVHSDSCFKTTRTDICTLPETQEHKHSDVCLSEPVQICENTDPAHVHEAACYTSDVICGLEETEGHSHQAGVCYTETTETVCGKNEGDAHVHAEECYTSAERYTCGLKVSEGHTHGETCYKTQEELTCKKPVSEGHTHTDECRYGLICGKAVTEGHQHNDACYAPTCDLPTDVPHKHEDACYGEEKTLICQRTEHVHGDKCYQSAGLEMINHTVDAMMGLVSVTGNLPAGVVLQADIQYGASDLEDLKAQLHSYLHEGAEVAFGYDIWLKLDGEEYQPEENEEVTVTVNVPSYVLTKLGYSSLEELEADLTLFHVHGERVDELVFTADYAESTLTFKVSDFSVFIGTVDNGETVELTAGKGYQFYAADGTTELTEAVGWTGATTIVVKPESGYVITDVKVNDGVNSSYVTIQDNAGVYTLSFTEPDASAETQIIKVTAKANGSEITFDLAKGDVAFTDDTYSGYDEDGNVLTGPHLSTNRYTIMQTDAETTYTDHTVSVGTPTVGGGVTSDFVIELQGINTRDTAKQELHVVGKAVFYVHNQDDSNVVVILADDSQNTLYAGTCHAGLEKGGGVNGDGTLVITCEAGYDAWLNDNDAGGHETCTSSCGKLDARSGNAWATNNAYQTYIAGAGIGTTGAGNAAKTNRLDCSGITFSSSSASGTGNAATAVDNSLKNLTIAGGNITAYGARGNSNYSGGGAGIGTGSTCTSSTSYKGGTIDGLKITGGNIEAYRGDYSAACIGGGYRTGDVSIDIHGGKITAEGVHPKAKKPSETQGAVRGAGIGAGGGGTTTGSVGQAFVNIYGGNITAYSQFGAAIGGGGGGSSAGGKYSKVTISGGTIVATTQGGENQTQEVNGVTVSLGRGAGAAIGTGGSLGSGSGGEANVIISGGHITANSQYGADIGGGGTNSPSNAVGGKAVVTIEKGEIYALTGGIGGGLANTGNGGEATVTISGGTINASSIGGGDSKTGNGGTATVIVNGSADITLKSGIGGGQVTETTGGNGGDAVVKISDGVIRSGSVGGGSTASTSGGKIGSAQITISGGDTAAQFIMAAGAELPCSFTMTAGELQQPLAGYTQVKPDGAAVWMDDPNGVATMSGGTISSCTAENGGAVYMTAGTFTLSGDALISGCKADNGGAVYMGGGTMNITGGSVSGSATKNGGAVYLGNGELNISGGSVSGTTAENGGAAYMGGGKLNISGGSITGSTAAQNGGGVYLGGGELNISGGEISNNTAANNGGGAYVNDGNIYMSGGTVSNNTATSGDGGGLYVSAETKDVSVMVFSGEVKNNRAAGAGGAVAVLGKTTANNNITVQTGVNCIHFGQDGNAVLPQNHVVQKTDGSVTYTHSTCPVISGNTTGEEGGAIYITGSTKTALNIYCLEETNNRVGESGDQLSHFLMVDGGKVAINTCDQSEQAGQDGDTGYGNISVAGTVHVSGGQVDLYGVMTNPGFAESISVDITGENDYFKDHRPNDGSYYKLHYFENFKDPNTGKPSGRYTAYQIAMNGKEKIRPVMYTHPGYEISGWNTDPDGNHNEYEHDHVVEGWYLVGDTYTFNGKPIGDLTLYAIWEPNVYTVIYDSNVPRGEKVLGSMEDQLISMDQAVSLTPNGYTYPGHRFVKWTVNADGTGQDYEDGATGVDHLCDRNGEKITLYAQWIPCDHNPVTCAFTYEVEENTLVRTCQCLAQVVQVTLEADNCVYKWDNTAGKAVEHPAAVEVKVAEGDLHKNDPWKTADPKVSYETADGSGWMSCGVPADAGKYRASLTAEEETIMVEYTVEKAFQMEPTVNGFVVSGNKLTVHPIDSSTHAAHDLGIRTMYQLYYYENKELKSQEPTTETEFTLKTSYTSYYVRVWYGEGKNHRASDYVDTEQVYYKGTTEIIFKAEPGILFSVEETTDGLEITVEAKENWYLSDDFEIKEDYEDESTPEEENLISVVTEKKTYQMSGIPDSTSSNKIVITVTITGAKQLAGIQTAVAEKKVFGSVTKDSASITCDSAFTAAYQISGFNSESYTDLSLQFAVLPQGTTILMMDKSNEAQTEYWHYTANGSKTVVPMTAFTRMGGTDRFATKENMNLQFIVDYSGTDNNCNGESAGIQLTATAKNGAPSLTSLYQQPVVTLYSPRTFSLESSAAQQEMTQQLTLTYGSDASVGVTSKWDGRAAALVLTQTNDAEIPGDAVIRITDASGSIRWPASRNGEGKLRFIIPLGAVQSDIITLKLESGMFSTEAQNYAFHVDWMIAASSSDGAPLNGTTVDKLTTISFQREAESLPSVKVYTDGNVRVIDSGSTMTVKVKTIVPATHTVTAKLLFKNASGGYSATAWEKTVTGSESQFAVPLDAAYGTGSFCFMVTVMHGTEIVQEAPYYFIIQEAAGGSGSDTSGTDAQTN